MSFLWKETPLPTHPRATLFQMLTAAFEIYAIGHQGPHEIMCLGNWPNPVNQRAKPCGLCTNLCIQCTLEIDQFTLCKVGSSHCWTKNLEWSFMVPFFAVNERDKLAKLTLPCPWQKSTGWYDPLRWHSTSFNPCCISLPPLVGSSHLVALPSPHFVVYPIRTLQKMNSSTLPARGLEDYFPNTPCFSSGSNCSFKFVL